VRWYYAGAYDNQVRISEWMDLEEGQQYYIEGDHQEFGGADFMTTAVELEQAELDPDHPHHVKE